MPVRASDAEQLLSGAEIAGEAFAEAGAAAAKEIDPVGDIHGSAAYRRQLTEVLVRRALSEAIGHG